MKNYEAEYKRNISKILKVEPDQIFLYWKGRIALYALLKSLGIRSSDEIVLPGFTCVVVPNAIKYLGAKPVYVDINTDTFNSDYEDIIKVVTEKTKVIIVQNTFGLSTDIDKISEWASKRGIYTIEDCTHGFGGVFNGKPNGSFCDASFFSTQWNKPYSTGLGGFAVVNNKKLLNNLKEVNTALITPGFLDNLQLNMLTFVHRILLNEKNYWIFRRLYRHLSRLNIILGSSQGPELRGPLYQSNYFKGATRIQSQVGSKNVVSILSLIEKRCEKALIYTNFLKLHGKNHVKDQYFRNHSFLKYPLLVKDRKLFSRLAENENIPLGDWFISPLHPVSGNFEQWDFVLDSLPNVKMIHDKIINLPTDFSNPDKVLRFLENNLELIV